MTSERQSYKSLTSYIKQTIYNLLGRYPPDIEDVIHDTIVELIKQGLIEGLRITDDGKYKIKGILLRVLRRHEKQSRR